MRLKSERLQKQFDREGAVVIPNFISIDKLDVINQYFKELKINDLNKIHSNALDENPELNKEIRIKFVELFTDSVNEHFEDCNIKGGAFLLKGTSENSVSSLHQDWTIVDESKFQSASIFCPVEDVKLENGCLQIIKGSHKWFNNVRSMSIPSVFLNFNQVKKGLKALPVKKGDVVLFNHRVFHGSKPNKTNKIRVAVAIGVTSKNAKSIYYHKVGDNVDVIETDNHFSDYGIAKIYNGKKYDYNLSHKVHINNIEVTDLETFNLAYRKYYPPSLMYKLLNSIKF